MFNNVLNYTTRLHMPMIPRKFIGKFPYAYSGRNIRLSDEITPKSLKLEETLSLC